MSYRRKRILAGDLRGRYGGAECIRRGQHGTHACHLGCHVTCGSHLRRKSELFQRACGRRRQTNGGIYPQRRDPVTVWGICGHLHCGSFADGRIQCLHETYCSGTYGGSLRSIACGAGTLFSEAVQGYR